MTKSIAPFQLRISTHRIIENMILGKIALPIYTIMSCSRLFVNSFLTNWQHQFLFTVLPTQQPTNKPKAVQAIINPISESSQNPQPKYCQRTKLSQHLSKIALGKYCICSFAR